MAGSLPVFLAVALLIGALLFGVGSIMVNASGQPQPRPAKPPKPAEAKVADQIVPEANPVEPEHEAAVEPAPLIAAPMIMAQPFVAETLETKPVWTRAFVDSEDELDVAARLEMVAQLALINEPWSESILQIARAEEHDADVRAAVEAALAAKSKA